MIITSIRRNLVVCESIFTMVNALLPHHHNTARNVWQGAEKARKSQGCLLPDNYWYAPEGEMNFKWWLFKIQIESVIGLQDLFTYSDEKAFGFEIGDGVARTIHMIGQGLRETLIEGGMLHIDDHAVDFLPGDHLGKSIGFFLRRKVADRHIPSAICQNE